MSLEAWGDGGMEADPVFDESRVGGGMSDIAAIAAGLTKAQREWLASHKISEKWLAAHGLENTAIMEKVGTTSRWGGEVYSHHRLTPLGLAVRTHLAQQESTHDQ